MQQEGKTKPKNPKLKREDMSVAVVGLPVFSSLLCHKLSQ